MKKIISWNLNGIRAVAKKGLVNIIHELDADIICFQETKAQDDQVLEALDGLNGYTVYSNSAIKKGIQIYFFVMNNQNGSVEVFPKLLRN